MVNKQRQKGNGFETLLVKLLNENLKGASFKRTPGSGALGTTFSEAILTGDVVGKVEGFPRPIKIEAKVGYNNLAKANKEVKSISLKKEWLDKVKEEALGNMAVPFLACKFDNVKSGVKYFMAVDFETFFNLINYMTDLKRELDLLYEAHQECMTKKTNSGST
jgi:hypothetical protein